jgi:hypothetical protein
VDEATVDSSGAETMPNQEKPTFYGLLFVDQETSDHVNLGKTHVDPFETYMRCAATCAASLAFHNQEFHLITNREEYVRGRMKISKLRDVSVIGHQFSLKVPPKIPFYSAHFKLDVVEAFGRGHFGEYVGLIDIDTVMCAPLNLPLIAQKTIISYDITEQMISEYGDYGQLRRDLERVSGATVNSPRWFGGEFLLGHMESFRLISEQVARMWPRYVDTIPELRHVSDEMLLSAALAALPGIGIVDAGDSGLLTRWWTARTAFKQSPFEQVLKRSILHLPSDKPFLASWADRSFDPTAFIAAYKRSARVKLALRRIYNTSRRLLVGEKKFVARIS